MRALLGQGGAPDELSRTVRDALDRFNRLPFCKSTSSQVLAVTLANTATNRINHGLKRLVSGYLVLYSTPVSASASAGGPSIDVRENTLSAVTFSSSQACTATLLIW